MFFWGFYRIITLEKQEKILIQHDILKNLIISLLLRIVDIIEMKNRNLLAIKQKCLDLIK